MHVRPPIRVVLVITELEVGGAERCLTELAVRLPRPEFEPEAISLAARPTHDLLVRQLESHQIRVSFLGLKRSLQLPRAVRRLAQRLREVPEAVVQSFLFHANVTAGLSMDDPGRHLLGVRVADPRRWRLAVERYVARRAGGVVCVSQSVAAFCRQRQRISPHMLHVIGNGVEIDGRPQQPGSPSGSQMQDASRQEPRLGQPDMPFDPSLPFLLYVGRLDPQKGLDWMLQCLPDVLAKFPQHQWVLAGQGHLEGSLRKQAAKLGIEGRVHFVGWVENPRAWMRASQLVVLPSRWEGMANVLLEAMAERKAVLSTRVEGVEEILGVRGEQAECQTVAFGDDRAFIRALSRLLDGSKLRSRLGDANYERVRRHFSLEAMVAAYADLFRQTAGR